MQSTPQPVVTSIRNIKNVSSSTITKKMEELREFLHGKGFPFQFGSFGIKTNSGHGINPELDGVRLYLESGKSKAQFIRQLKQKGIPDNITNDIKEIVKDSYFNFHNTGNGPNLIYFKDQFPEIPREQGGGSSASQTQQHVVQSFQQGGGASSSQQQGGGASSPKQQDEVVQHHTVSTIHSVSDRRIGSDTKKLKQYLDNKNFHFNYGIFKTKSPTGWTKRVDRLTDPVELYLEGGYNGYKTKSQLIQDLKSKGIPNNVCQLIKVIKKEGNPATKLYYFSSIPTLPESSLDTTLSSSPQGGVAMSQQSTTITRKKVPQGWTALKR